MTNSFYDYTYIIWNCLEKNHYLFIAIPESIKNIQILPSTLIATLVIFIINHK